MIACMRVLRVIVTENNSDPAGSIYIHTPDFRRWVHKSSNTCAYQYAVENVVIIQSTPSHFELDEITTPNTNTFPITKGVSRHKRIQSRGGVGGAIVHGDNSHIPQAAILTHIFLSQHILSVEQLATKVKHVLFTLSRWVRVLARLIPDQQPICWSLPSHTQRIQRFRTLCLSPLLPTSDLSNTQILT